MVLHQQFGHRPAPASRWRCGRQPYGDAHAQAAYRRDASVLLTYLDVVRLDLLAVRLLHLDVFARTRLAAGNAPAALSRRFTALLLRQRRGHPGSGLR